MSRPTEREVLAGFVLLLSVIVLICVIGLRLASSQDRVLPWPIPSIASCGYETADRLLAQAETMAETVEACIRGCVRSTTGATPMGAMKQAVLGFRRMEQVCR